MSVQSPKPDGAAGRTPDDPLQTASRARRIGWITALVFVINLAGLGLLWAYSRLNLFPDLADIGPAQRDMFAALALLLAVVAPTVASRLHVRPVLLHLRSGHAGGDGGIAAWTVHRAANTPLVAAAYSLLGWSLLTIPAIARWALAEPGVGLGVAAHLVLRPLLAGMIAATAVLFAAESVCRAYVWPTLLRGTRIAGNPRLWRLRLSHRLFLLWLAISVIPLAVIALTTYTRIVGAQQAADPVFGRMVAVILMVTVSAMLGGAWLAWTVARSIAQPLEALESATVALSEGRFDTRVVVSATDEFGALFEGFNLAAQRLSRSYADLEARNRELAQALDRVTFLEQVKQALDRFVPETVRQAIEANPDAPGLAKEARDVTVLFLDIEGYSRLSEELSRPALNALVERYFSLFLESIRSEGGDINETAGDGLMIIFQTGGPAAHAAAALRAALAIQAQTAAANQSPASAGPALRINIGIGSGECDVGTTRFQGTVGERWTFTASGPATIMASRLSDHAHGGQVLLSAETERRIRGQFTLRALEPVSLNNLSQPVQLWEAV